MRAFLIIFLSIPLMAATPIFNTHDNKNDLESEIKNIYDNLSGFRQFTSTPSYQELEEGEIVIFSTTAAILPPNVWLMLRSGATVYYSPSFSIIRGR